MTLECAKGLAMMWRMCEFLIHDIQVWLKFGLKIKHLPIPDFGTPSLDDLHGLIDWIKQETEDGRAVFVHL